MQAELMPISTTMLGVAAHIDHVGYKIYQEGNNLFAHVRFQYIRPRRGLAPQHADPLRVPADLLSQQRLTCQPIHRRWRRWFVTMMGV